MALLEAAIEFVMLPSRMIHVDNDNKTYRPSIIIILCIFFQKKKNTHVINSLLTCQKGLGQTT